MSEKDLRVVPSEVPEGVTFRSPARTVQEIAAEVRSITAEWGAKRALFVDYERAAAKRIDELNDELTAAQAADAKKTPEAMLARIEALESKQKEGSE